MTRCVLALCLLERFSGSTHREALIGDLIEEIAEGRSRLWVWQQVLGLCALTALASLRERLFQAVPLVVCVLLIASAWVTQSDRLFKIWGVVYVTAGVVSLFLDVISSWTVAVRPHFFEAASSASNAADTL